MKYYNKFTINLISVLLFLFFFINCSSAPDWLKNKWDLVSYGTEPECLFGNILADALGNRFYWEIENNTIIGYMQEGWKGTLTSLFSNSAAPESDKFVKRSELTFNTITSTPEECQIEIVEGTELYAIASQVSLREVNEGEIIIFRKLGNNKIAMDREVDFNGNNIQDQAAKMLMQKSSSLINVDGVTFNRLILATSFK